MLKSRGFAASSASPDLCTASNTKANTNRIAAPTHPPSTTRRGASMPIANPAAVTQFGYLSTELIGVDASTLFETKDDWNAVWRDAIQGITSAQSRTLIGRRKNGDRSHLEASASSWKTGSRIFATVILRDINERRAIEIPDNGDFPTVTESSPEAWAEALRELDRQHARLTEAVAGLDEAALGESVAGEPYSTAHMIRGVAQHMAYHAGQIALLRKLA